MKTDVQTEAEASEQEKDELIPMPLRQVCISLWECFYDKRFFAFIPQLCWTGISISFYSGILTQLISDTIDGDVNVKYQNSILAMIPLGIGEIFGCFYIGFIVDKYGSRVATLANIFNCFIMTAVTLVYCVNFNYTWVAYLMTFMWGF